MSSSKGVKGGGHLGDSEGSESSFMSDTTLAAAMATVVRAPHKDFIVVKKEWAAIRIQAAFRGFLVIFMFSLFAISPYKNLFAT